MSKGDEVFVSYIGLHFSGLQVHSKDSILSISHIGPSNYAIRLNLTNNYLRHISFSVVDFEFSKCLTSVSQVTM